MSDFYCVLIQLQALSDTFDTSIVLKIEATCILFISFRTIRFAESGVSVAEILWIN